MSRGPWKAVDLRDTLKAKRVFHPGQAVRWNPPHGAYSPQSLQARHAGQTGVVERVYNECYLLASFSERGGVLLNVDFVEEAP